MSISVSLKRVTAVAAAIAFVLSAFAVTSASAATCNFTLSHKLGQTGGEIKSIQQFLNANGFTVSASGVGSAGMETSYFGGKTKAAIMAFQAAKGVSPVSGYWGPLTRAAANASCEGGPVVVNPTPTPTAGNAVVAAAPQPGNSLAPGGAARVPFTKFTVTAGATPVTLNSVVVERGGLANDNNFAGAVLLDDTGAQLGVQQSFNSNHQATVGTPVVIPAGATKTFTIAANMVASPAGSGQVAVMSVVAVNASGTVAGSLPITGAQHTINSTLTLGTVTAGISSFDPQSAQSKNIGDTAVRFAALRVTAGSAEDVRFWGVRFRLNGSASASDLANVKVNVDGTDYDATWSADGRYASAMVPGGLKIEKGFNKDMYIKGDITGSNASGRTIQFDIDRRTDILFTGELYGYGITPTGNSFGTIGTAQTGSALQTSSDNPWYQGPDVTVTGASVTSIAKASEVPAQNIAVNVPSVNLGGFYTDIKGESLNVSSICVDVTYSTGPGTSRLTNVSLVDANGAIVSGPVDEVSTLTCSGAAAAATQGRVTFSNQVTIPTGKKVYTIKGKVGSAVTNNSTIVLSTTPSSTTFWTNVVGNITGNTVTLPGASFNMNTMTIRTASLTPSVNTGLSTQTIVAGLQNAKLAMIDIDATASGEDVRLSSVPVSFTMGGALTLSHLSSCQLWDGTTALNTGSNVPSTVAATQNLILDNSLVVTKGTKKTLTLACNIQSGTTGTVQGGIQVGASWTGITGITSGNTVTATNIAATANTQTVVAGGSYTVLIDASSPSAQLVTGGASNVTLGVIKVRSSNEDINLTEMLLELTSGTSASLAGSQVTVWDGATQVGTASITGTTGIAYFSPSVVVVKDTDKKLTIKANLSAIGTNQTGVAGARVAVNYDGNTLTSTKATGASSGSQLNPTSADTATAGIIAFKSFPTIARIALPASNNLVNGTQDLYRLSVKADAAGDISLNKITFNSTATNTGGAALAYTAATAKVIAYTDAGFSTPVGGVFTSGQVVTGGSITSGTDFEAVFSSPLVIPAGSTYYFKLVSDITGVDASGESITTKMLGDDTYNAVGTYATIHTLGTTLNNFVWSGNSFGNATIGAGPVPATDVDWHNAFQVVGLPATGSDASTNTRAN